MIFVEGSVCEQQHCSMNDRKGKDVYFMGSSTVTKVVISHVSASKHNTIDR